LVDDSVTPVWELSAVVIVTLVAAVVLAVVPGRRASAVAPASVLRSE